MGVARADARSSAPIFQIRGAVIPLPRRAHELASALNAGAVEDVLAPKRKHKRVSVSTPARMVPLNDQLEPGLDVFEISIRNISSSGACFLFTRAINKGVFLVIRIDHPQKVIAAVAEVVRVRSVERFYEIGVRLVSSAVWNEQDPPPKTGDTTISKALNLAAMAMPTVARQPIVNRKGELFGYEILYRAPGQSTFDGNTATSSTLLDLLVDIGLDNLVGGKRAFINFTDSFLEKDFPFTECAGRIVVEALEDIVLEPSILDSIRRLREMGFLVAADDVIYDDSLIPLFEIVDIIKLEAPAIPKPRIRFEVARFKRFKATLLAEKIETQEDFEAYADAGCQLFQGFFFAKPQAMSGGEKKAARDVAAVELLSKIQSASLEELEAVIKRDETLSFRLMRYLKNASLGLSQDIGSLRQAIILLGPQRVRMIAMLVMLASRGGKAPALLPMALVRARVCEQLATERSHPSPELAFLVGLFSLLDAVFDRPMKDLVSAIPIPREAQIALLDRQGPLGEYLRAAISLEGRDELDTPNNIPQDSGRIMAEAFRYSQSILTAEMAN